MSLVQVLILNLDSLSQKHLQKINNINKCLCLDYSEGNESQNEEYN